MKLKKKLLDYLITPLIKYERKQDVPKEAKLIYRPRLRDREVEHSGECLTARIEPIRSLVGANQFFRNTIFGNWRQFDNTVWLRVDRI